MAMLKNRYDCVKTLIDLKDTDVNCKDDRGRSLVSCVLENLNDQSFETISFLLREKKADVNLPDKDGWGPLHFACQKTKTGYTQPRYNRHNYYGGGGYFGGYDQPQTAIANEEEENRQNTYLRLIVSTNDRFLSN